MTDGIKTYAEMAAPTFNEPVPLVDTDPAPLVGENLDYGTIANPAHNEAVKAKLAGRGYKIDPNIPYLKNYLAERHFIPKPAPVEFGFTDDEIELIKLQIAPDLNDLEFRYFMWTAKHYKLNPLTKEIYATKYKSKQGDKVSIFPGVHGLLELARRTGKLNEANSGAYINAENELVGWARVRRKDQDYPYYVEVNINEYRKDNLWLSKPRTMIAKVALAQCIRLAFGFAGMFDSSEIEDMPRPLGIDQPFELPEPARAALTAATERKESESNSKKEHETETVITPVDLF
jgi:phage recombination protein Bet